MKQKVKTPKTTAALVAGLAAVVLSGAASTAMAKDSIKIAVPAFLSGPAAGPFGVPARNGAEMVIDAINGGTLPEPYNTAGFAGAAAEVIFIDEAGGNAKQVPEYRNLVQKREVDLVAGYISSGTCAALAPVIEELQRLTIFATCGTPRIFEEAPRNYIFRSMAHATADNVAAAHYVRELFPDAHSYTGINQNYAWGQDSWRDYDLTMKALDGDAKASEKIQFPKIFAGQYGTEISALSLDKSDIVHSSFWGGDLESFISQANIRGLFKKKKAILTVGGTAAYRLGKKLPDDIILGARGPYGILVREVDTPLNNWFINTYKDRYGTYPSGPSYQYAQAILTAKYGYDKAMKENGGTFPEQDQIIAAIKGSSFESFSTTVNFALGGGHQAITESVYGITKYDNDNGEPGVSDVKFYPAECVMPPDGQTSVEWIEGGMKGAQC